MKVCAISGSDGYLGSRVCQFFKDSSWTVYRMSRHGSSDSDTIPFLLEGTLDPGVFRQRNIDAFIHCAYDFSALNWSQIYKINVEGSRRIFQAAKKGGVQRIIFISSLSAFDHCVSLFGKAKRAIEEDVLLEGGDIIRSGLIYGEPPGGIVGNIVKQVLSSRIVPVIRHEDKPLFFAHRDDLAELVLKLAEGQGPPSGRPIAAAAHNPWTLSRIVAKMAEQAGRHVVLVPIPWRMAWLGLKIMETLGVRTPFRSDSVLSLATQDPPLILRGTQDAGITFREFGS